MEKQISDTSEIRKINFSAFCIQFLASLVINSLTGLTSFVFAWPSYNIANFVSNETVLERPLSTFEVSLLGSLPNIGALVLVPFCGYTIDTIGRRSSAIIFGIPYVITWTIISVTSSVPIVLCALAVAGVACGGQVVTAVYIAELAHDKVRGTLNALNVVQFFSGLMFSYWLGGCLSYQHVIYVHVTLSVAYIAAVACLAESPIFLLHRGRDEEAAKAISFYRGLDKDSKEVENILSQMKEQLKSVSPNFELKDIENAETDVTKNLIRNQVENITKKRLSPWQIIKSSESTKRAIVIIMTLMALSILMGSAVLQVFAEPLFHEAIPSISANLCSIVLAAVSLIASMLGTAVVDIIGRKRLIVASCVLAAVSAGLITIQLIWPFAPRWTTASLIFAYCFVYTAGAIAGPAVVCAEVFLPEIRGFCNSLVMGCVCLMNFITAFAFEYIMGWVGLSGTFAIFCAVSCTMAGFTMKWVPETKGRPVGDIQVLFSKKTG